MAVKRVTMQDIADACGLSRNTVSKVFNGRGSVPEATKRLIFAKAQELRYNQFPSEAGKKTDDTRHIALLTQHRAKEVFGKFIPSTSHASTSRNGDFCTTGC